VVRHSSIDELSPSQISHGALDARMIGRSRSGLDLPAHRFAPGLAAEVELIGQLVPQTILASDLGQDEVAVELLIIHRRSRMVEAPVGLEP
jgi:hypothetical protein